MKFLRYFYFRLYTYYSGHNSGPILSSFLAIFVALFLNLLTVLNIYICFFPEQVFEFPAIKGTWGKLLTGLVMLPFFGLWYYIFKTRGYNDKIIMEFQHEDKRSKFISIILVLAYGIGTILFFILSLYLKKHALD